MKNKVAELQSSVFSWVRRRRRGRGGGGGVLVMNFPSHARWVYEDPHKPHPCYLVGSRSYHRITSASPEGGV